MVKMDKIFEEYLRTRVLTAEMKKVIKSFMTEVSNFANARIAYLKSLNIITDGEASKMISNYNKIWNTLQSEYSTFFSQADIDEIHKKAQVYRTKFACATNPNNNGTAFVKRML